MSNTAAAILISQITTDHGRVLSIECLDVTPDTCDSCRTVWHAESLRYQAELFLCPLCD